MKESRELERLRADLTAALQRVDQLESVVNNLPERQRQLDQDRHSQALAEADRLEAERRAAERQQLASGEKWLPVAGGNQEVSESGQSRQRVGGSLTHGYMLTPTTDELTRLRNRKLYHDAAVQIAELNCKRPRNDYVENCIRRMSDSGADPEKMLAEARAARHKFLLEATDYGKPPLTPLGPQELRQLAAREGIDLGDVRGKTALIVCIREGRLAKGQLPDLDPAKRDRYLQPRVDAPDPENPVIERSTH